MKNIAQEKLSHALSVAGTEEFTFKDVVFCGEDAVLVNPAICGTNWTQDNKYLRSIIYRKSDLKVLSSGFPKFTNYGENPTHFPEPVDLLDSWIMSKEDGSLLCIDYVNNAFSMRTRGTVTYKTLENYKDFEIAIDKYPNIIPWIKNHEHLTLLFEIVTPNQRIVLDYPEIDLFLIGAMDKNTLKLENQVSVGSFAMEMCVPRPEMYHFDTLSELIKTMTEATGIEGCCLYQRDGIWKIKSQSYLKLHSFKSNATPKNVLNLYIEKGFPSFKKFKEFILNEFDYECWKMVEDLVTQVCVYKKEVDSEIKDIQKFVNNYKNLTDKEFAFKVIDKEWKGIAFGLRKENGVSTKTIKKKIKEKL